jgi:bifunctional UDP-N-acetylglucosamine pyrophosphorylase/glucosamine-1-phosphate N-acetyltransferase
LSVQPRCLSRPTLFCQQLPEPKNWTAAEDHRNMMEQLGIQRLRPGPSGNESTPNHAGYDESLANPYPQLPDEPLAIVAAGYCRYNTIMESPVTIVILAAGLGTRMKSRHAKVLHRAGGRTLVEHVVRTALQVTTPERIFIVIGHQADEVQATLAPYGVGFVRQTEQKGTGHALMACSEVLSGLDGLLVILYGDGPLLTVPTLRRLIDTEKNSSAAGTILTAIMPDPTGYGRVIRNAQGDVKRVVEQKAGTPEELAVREANMGLYCYQARPFWAHIGEIQPNNPAREYYLTDMVEILSAAGCKMQTMVLEDPQEVLGINDRVELAMVDRLLRERKIRQLMLDGVTIEKPETVTIDGDVEIGMDTVIEAFVQIRGKTKIGQDCRIGACSVISDSELADQVEVGPYTIINTSKLERAVHAGPYSRLRLDNYVEEGAHIGNFVELKKTRLGAGAKALHLAYLGDSTIGRKVNIGAGTITCNYDGVSKNQTKIGDGAFVGSNSTLVAPMEIGAGAYLGAGSVVTHPVPADALALGRARQIVKEGWARARREKTKRQ